MLELREAQVAKAVVSTYELSMVIGGCKLDVFGFLGWRQGVKGMRHLLDDP